MLRKTIFRFKRAFLVLLLVHVFLLTAVSVAIGESLWKPGEFMIAVFAIGQGDSQLIVSPSGKTLLIDVGEMSANSGKIAALVDEKLKNIMGPGLNHIDYIVATHLHLDHIGYVGKGGIWALIENYGYTVGKLIDRDSGVWVDKNEDGECDYEDEIEWHNAGTTSGTGGLWICYATDPANASKLNREIAEMGSTSQIDLGQDVVVKVIERDAKNVKMKNGKTSVLGNRTKYKVPPSENDYSLTLKISYKNLDYVTGGDTDGEYAKSKYGYTYNDVETKIAPSIGEVEIMHVNHHGSGHSSNQTYIDTLKPTVSLISCGYKNRYKHPDQNTLDRLLSATKVYLTDECDPNKNYGESIFVKGDIVIKSIDGVNYTVNNDSYVASGSQ